MKGYRNISKQKGITEEKNDDQSIDHWDHFVENKLDENVRTTLEKFQERFPGMKLKFGEWHMLSLVIKKSCYESADLFMSKLEETFPNKEGSSRERDVIRHLHDFANRSVSLMNMKIYPKASED